MKKCGMCKVVKELTEFNKNKSRKDGRGTNCRECAKIKSKEYYSKNTEYH